MKTRPIPAAPSAAVRAAARGSRREARIVCCTDFSPNAQRAADVAAALARRSQAKLELVHVADQPASQVPTSAEREALLTETRNALAREALRLGLADAATTVALAGGWAEVEIARHLQADPPDLVVVAAVSKTPFERWTLGSVSEEIAQRSPVPTLVVRRPDPLLAWADMGAAPTILVGTPEGAAGAEVLTALATWLKPLPPARLVLGQINWPPRDRSRYGGDGPLPLQRNPVPVQRLLERDLGRLARETLGRREIELVIRPSWGRPDLPLIELARRRSADLLVIGSHQRQGWDRVAQGSLSRALLRHAPSNVLCLPLGWASSGEPSRVRYQHVLVATDFSPLGNHALACGVAAAASGGTVRLVHVERSAPAARGGSRNGQQESENAGALRQLAAGLRRRDVRIETAVLRHEEPALAIVQEAARVGADLVCVGSRGRGRLAGALLGSVAQEVVVRSTRPVLVARKEAD